MGKHMTKATAWAERWPVRKMSHQGVHGLRCKRDGINELVDRFIGVVNAGSLIELATVLDKAADMRFEPLVLVQIPPESVQAEDHTIFKGHDLCFELEGCRLAFLDGIDCDFNFHSLHNGAPFSK